MKLFLRSSLFLLVLMSAVTHSQQTPQTLVVETNYLLYLPDGYNSGETQKWPLVIFLHGSGERGDDVNKVKVNGPPKLVVDGKKFPFILVSPQAREGERFEPSTVKKLIDNLKTNYRIDADRVYLTGLSMGGFGTWKIAQEYPQEFAAIAPVCGGGDASRNYRLRHIPVWNFHGAKDDVVLPIESVQMIDSLKKYSSDVKFTLYPDANHNSWDATYANDSLYTWLLSHKKFRFKRGSMRSDNLEQYAGTYETSTGKGLEIAVDNRKLMIWNLDSPNEKFELIPTSDTNFYLIEDLMVELKFKAKRNRIKPEFQFYDTDQILNYKKIKPKKS